jgi:hypothetical protein
MKKEATIGSDNGEWKSKQQQKHFFDVSGSIHPDSGRARAVMGFADQRK